MVAEEGRLNALSKACKGFKSIVHGAGGGGEGGLFRLQTGHLLNKMLLKKLSLESHASLRAIRREDFGDDASLLERCAVRVGHFVMPNTNDSHAVIICLGKFRRKTRTD